MNCPRCSATTATQLSKKTFLGYRVFRCKGCHRIFNERTGTIFNHLQFPTDVVLLVVLWRLRYKLSLRDLAEMFLVRGFEFTHEAVRDWEARFAPLVTEQLRVRRKGKAGYSWHCDETYLKVGGKWCYLYRAIDRDGNIVDSMLSEHRDMDEGHRSIKQRYYPIRGFGSFDSASRFCLAFDEQRDYFRYRTRPKQVVPL